MGAADYVETKKQTKALQNKIKHMEAKEKRDKKMEEKNAELFERESHFEEECMETEVDQKMEVDEKFEPPSLIKRQEEEVKQLMSSLLKEKLGKLANLVTR